MKKYIILTILALYTVCTFAQTNNTSQRPFLTPEGKASYFFGLNVGDQNGFLNGFKYKFYFRNPRFLLLPEVFLGAAKNTIFGANANVAFLLTKASRFFFTPYIGAGAGLNKIDRFKFDGNLLVGTYMRVKNGSMFLEYTSRNFCENNQLIFGYRVTISFD